MGGIANTGIIGRITMLMFQEDSNLPTPAGLVFISAGLLWLFITYVSMLIFAHKTAKTIKIAEKTSRMDKQFVLSLGFINISYSRIAWLSFLAIFWCIFFFRAGVALAYLICLVIAGKADKLVGSDYNYYYYDNAPLMKSKSFCFTCAWGIFGLIGFLFFVEYVMLA